MPTKYRLNFKVIFKDSDVQNTYQELWEENFKDALLSAFDWIGKTEIASNVKSVQFQSLVNLDSLKKIIDNASLST